MQKLLLLFFFFFASVNSNLQTHRRSRTGLSFFPLQGGRTKFAQKPSPLTPNRPHSICNIIKVGNADVDAYFIFPQFPTIFGAEWMGLSRGNICIKCMPGSGKKGRFVCVIVRVCVLRGGSSIIMDRWSMWFFRVRLFYSLFCLLYFSCTNRGPQEELADGKCFFQVLNLYVFAFLKGGEEVGGDLPVDPRERLYLIFLQLTKTLRFGRLPPRGSPQSFWFALLIGQVVQVVYLRGGIFRWRGINIMIKCHFGRDFLSFFLLPPSSLRSFVGGLRKLNIDLI